MGRPITMTKQEIFRFLHDNFRRTTVESFRIRENGVVDVTGSLTSNDDFDNEYEFLPIQFGKISGSCLLSCCKLLSLRGCPTQVGGSFDIDNCPNLTSLRYGPKIVAGQYNMAASYSIRDLTGMPDECSDIPRVSTRNCRRR